MGGDFGPAIVVAGSVDGAAPLRDAHHPRGRQDRDRRRTREALPDGLDIAVIHTPEAVEMDESPAMAVRKKPRSSINLAIQEIKNGDAHAMISAGNSGAVMAGAFMILGRIPGIERPALTTLLPSSRTAALLIDLGAVVEPKAHNLVEFAYMAKIYREKTTGRANPSIGLAIQRRGTRQRQRPRDPGPRVARRRTRLEFSRQCRRQRPVGRNRGYHRDRRVFREHRPQNDRGRHSTLQRIDRATTERPRRPNRAGAARAALQIGHTIMDYAEIGGAPLLGVNGAMVVCHGRSSRRAMCNAVGMGLSLAKLGVVSEIAAAMAHRTQTRLRHRRRVRINAG